MTTIRQQSPKLGKRKKPFEKAVTYEKKEGLLTNTYWRHRQCSSSFQLMQQRQQLSSRAVGESENPGGWASINPRPFKEKVLFLFLPKSGVVIVPSAPRVPTALRVLSSSRYSSQGLGYSPGSIATFFSFSGRQLLASSCLNLSLMKEGSNESIQGNIESRPGFIYLILCPRIKD